MSDCQNDATRYRIMPPFYRKLRCSFIFKLFTLLFAFKFFFPHILLLSVEMRDRVKVGAREITSTDPPSLTQNRLPSPQRKKKKKKKNTAPCHMNNFATLPRLDPSYGKS